MQRCAVRLGCVAALAALLAMLGGCEDTSARQDAEAARRQGDALKLETETEQRLRAEVMNSVKEMADATKKQIEGFQMDFDGRLRDALTVKVAEQMDNLRREIETNREELLGFMDKQLKELYPYAYQPRRLEEPGPPNPPQP
jgi:type IV pilus biogenesis protein CpaD/CtpE